MSAEFVLCLIFQSAQCLSNLLKMLAECQTACLNTPMRTTREHVRDVIHLLEMSAGQYDAKFHL